MFWDGYCIGIKSPALLSQMLLLIDDACFTRNGNLNTRNRLTWADENLHSFQGVRFQQEFTINAWVGIFGDLLLGPYELPSIRSLVFTLQSVSE